jgi:drug/metabolite transporter (DMT)-like permease
VTATTWLSLALSIALATTGQLLLKAGIDATGATVALQPRALLELVRTVATSWRLLLGFAAFASSALFWLAALSRVPLSVAYPVVSLSYVLILAASVVVLGERPSVTTLGGALLVMLGVALIGIGQR